MLRGPGPAPLLDELLVVRAAQLRATLGLCIGLTAPMHLIQFVSCQLDPCMFALGWHPSALLALLLFGVPTGTLP